MKYKLKSTSVQIAGIVHKKGEKTIFDVESPKWKPLKSEIESAFDSGYLEMTKDSAKKAKADADAKAKADAEKKK